ncbi:RidA family protein [Pelagibacterium lentulum]|uniref:Endoribonuclease L-PSP/chorismate mutase-like domain-containing protein n=1 Tax=Pelagibacterium lentulum TaxID=2029865 RepID=A0A916W2T8_9HYPH|nr:RidA family protein [Pelagibacterium lentulum]GGA61705.1 hypothetical protein GCM10011499_35040 [Pelagibacterium lentulum]
MQNISLGVLEARIADLSLDLPQVSELKGNYRSYEIVGNLIYISGQLPMGPGGEISVVHTGRVGSKITESDGYDAARLCLLNVLAHARLGLGSLDRIVQCVRLGGFVNVEPDYTTPGLVMNGASDTIVDIMGSSGRHSRTTLGVASLPLGACVEVEAIFEFDPER